MVGYEDWAQEKPWRTMIGVGMNLPIQLSRRHAAVAENVARLAQRQAQMERLVDRINFEVQEAHARVQENRQILELYEKQLIPAAQTNVKEAISAYAAGRIPLLSLLEAQRNLVSLRDRYFEVIADYYRSLAMLERAVGGPWASTNPTASSR
jgi:cobalt-zinc-cadmium efflux system outer membrane protein